MISDDDGKPGSRQPGPHASSSQEGATTPGNAQAWPAGNVEESHCAPIGHRSAGPSSSTFVCDICQDTHRMELGDRTVMCTHCPLPCQLCRVGGTGPYCTTTPCTCACHTLKGADARRQVVTGHRIRNPNKGPRWWLDAIEALSPEDPCEVKCNSTGQWLETAPKES